MRLWLVIRGTVKGHANIYAKLASKGLANHITLFKFRNENIVWDYNNNLKRHVF